MVFFSTAYEATFHRLMRIVQTSLTQMVFKLAQELNYLSTFNTVIRLSCDQEFSIEKVCSEYQEFLHRKSLQFRFLAPKSF